MSFVIPAIGAAGQKIRSLFMMCAVVLMAAIGGLGESQAATITVDSGWLAGTVTDTESFVEYQFVLDGDSVLSLTDCCKIGRDWILLSDFVGYTAPGLSPISLPLGIGSSAGLFDAAWLDASLPHFQTILSAGSYILFVLAVDPNYPATFGIRIDTATVPLPATGAMLLGAFAALGALRRRKTT